MIWQKWPPMADTFWNLIFERYQKGPRLLRGG